MLSKLILESLLESTNERLLFDRLSQVSLFQFPLERTWIPLLVIQVSLRLRSLTNLSQLHFIKYERPIFPILLKLRSTLLINGQAAWHSCLIYIPKILFPLRSKFFKNLKSASLIIPNYRPVSLQKEMCKVVIKRPLDAIECNNLWNFVGLIKLHKI